MNTLALIGRDYSIIEALAKKVHETVRREGDYTQLRTTTRGQTFQIMLPDGHVARVTVELDYLAPSQQEEK